MTLPVRHDHSVIFKTAPAPAPRANVLLGAGGEGWRDEELREWPPLEWPEEPVRPAPPSRGTVLQVRLLSLLGVIALVAFFGWLLEPEKRGDGWLYWPLVIAIGFRALWWVVEWLNYARPRLEPFVRPKREWTVDVLTTACPGEPRGMILRTLLAMKAIRYPHTNYLCDEGDDPVLRQMCAHLGVRHVTRTVKKDAKAGNINNALAQATGEIAVVLDPDHEPAPYLLDRVLGYFEDPRVGFVQSVQAYRNQKDSLVADGAAKQTYLFYGPVMIGMNAYGTTQAIGANCVFRRAALDSIGGHAAGLAEDMHTTMRLYAKGWRSVYVPEILTRGLVPSTLSAYCKQQVKWACGSIELLLQELPKLFRGMTFWQRLHYAVAPLYFLRGVFGFISIVVPIVCLLIGGVALRIDLIEYLAMFMPAMIVATAIRQLTQRWTIEKTERGAHLIGGLLGSGCWWVFLRGVLCAVFRIKLPYIPTPKENEAHDSWGLAVPNLVAAALSITAVIYGLSRDWTPYNWMMAGFALWNAAQLTFVAALGQQRTLQRIAYAVCRHDWAGKLMYPLEKARFYIHCAILRLMRERAMAISLFVVCAGLAFHFRPHSPVPIETAAARFKDTGGFYVGVRMNGTEPFPDNFEAVGTALGTKLRLFPFTRRWAPESEQPFPSELMRQARLRDAVPLMTWEPSTAAFRVPGTAAEPGTDRHVFASVLNGAFDDFLVAFAERMRDFGEPVLIRFAPGPDNPANPWSATGGNSAQDFIEAWEYIVALFNDAGAANVGWVWQPASPAGLKTHLPSVATIDWISIPALNTGTLGGGKWREFSEIYQAYRREVEPLRLPVLVGDFGSAPAGGDAASWMRRALTGIAADYPEIRGVVLPGENSGWFATTPEVTSIIAAGLRQSELREMPPPPVELHREIWSDRKRTAIRSPSIAGSPGQYEFMVDGEPFYIRGVAYNPGHDWRDGFTPLTRRELDADFARLRATGANTIRRYGTNWYDRNILRAATEQDLKVLFGFWFGQQIDYRSDSAKLARYAAQVERTVAARRNEPAVIAWSLGNEVWGLLKHHYAQPYLTEVRHAHVDFVERLARRVHDLDPKRPVFVAHEHSPQLAGALADFARGAPSLDFTAINSYYEQRISRLYHFASRLDPSRPYLVSEFGPDGYWEQRPGQRTQEGALLEPTATEKVRSYERAWAVHTLPHRGANIGGVAYCWRDRYEATATWFGLTDPDGRLKPAGLALQRLWTGRDPSPGPRIVSLQGPRTTVLPGATVTVSAEVETEAGEQSSFRWRMASEDFNFEIGKIAPAPGAPRAQITMPRKPGNYRIYFAVTDGRATDEANIPVCVSRNVSVDIDIPANWTTVPLMRRIVGP